VTGHVGRRVTDCQAEYKKTSHEMTIIEFANRGATAVNSRHMGSRLKMELIQVTED